MGPRKELKVNGLLTMRIQLPIQGHRHTHTPYTHSNATPCLPVKEETPADCSAPPSSLPAEARPGSCLAHGGRRGCRGTMQFNSISLSVRVCVCVSILHKYLTKDGASEVVTALLYTDQVQSKAALRSWWSDPNWPAVFWASHIDNNYHRLWFWPGVVTDPANNRKYSVCEEEHLPTRRF